MPRESPARPFVGEQVHMEYTPAAAGAKQRSLFKEAVIFDNIKGVWIEVRRKRVPNNGGVIGR